MKKLLLSLLLFAALPALAETNLLGRWQSEPLSEGTEKMTEELFFKDSDHMEFAFVTDNTVPGVGHMVTRMSVKATYKMMGPMFYAHLDVSSVETQLMTLDLEEEYISSLPSGIDRKSAENLIRYQAEQQGRVMFSMMEEVSMIYVTHKDTEDTISFILGDEKNAMEMIYHRVK